MAAEYVFIDEWDVDAPQEAVFEALADARTYLTGKGAWTLTPRDGRVHIHFDWRVLADRPLLRVLTPVLRPVFRWNHNWSIQRAMEGLERYAQARAAERIG
jgi:hypothetical protein